VRSEDSQTSAPIYWAHRAVFFAIAMLSYLSCPSEIDVCDNVCRSVTRLIKHFVIELVCESACSDGASTLSIILFRLIRGRRRIILVM